VIDHSDKTVDDILSKLLFLSKLKEGEKINTYDFCIEDNSWWTTLRRTIFRDQSREKTLEFIRSLIDSALETSSKCFESQDELHRNIGNLIIETLEQSRIGITNLIKTYETDRMFVSKLETLLGILKEKTDILKVKVSKTSHRETRETGSKK
jgi:methanogenic corrinoid protein MtbC1